MFEKFDLDDFEPFLVKGIVSDIMVLSTLGRFLTNPKLFFKNENYALVVNFYKFFFEKREKLPTKDELILFLNKKEYKHAIDSVFNEIEHINYEGMDKDLFLKSAERFIKERGIIQTMISVAGELEKGEINSSKVLEKFEQVCNITLDNEKGLDLYEDISNILTALKEKKRTISTGFKSLDKYIDGGFYEDGKALYLFMAPPNKGKSLFLGNIACNIANQGKTVLLITLEMSELAYASRFCSQQTAIPFAELHLRTDEVKEKMKNKPGKIIIKEFPPSTITVPTLKGWIKKHIVEKGIKIDALCIDYINLFDGPGNNLYEKLKGIAEHTRALSYWLSVPVVSLTQQNRCLAEDTGLINDKNQIISIKNIKEGDLIKGKNGYVKVLSVFPPTKQKVYRITTKSGRQIKCSINHIFPTINGEKNIKNGLKIGDKLFISSI